MSWYNHRCKQCEKDFERRKKYVKFCSTECYRASRPQPVTKTCEFCEESFTVPYRHREKKYCNQKCMGKAYAETMKGERFTVWCQSCGEEFEVKESRADAKFCSLACKFLDMRDGESEFVTRTCEECEEDFVVPYIRRIQRFCGKSCANRGERNVTKRPEIAAKISENIKNRILEGQFKPHTHYKSGHFHSAKCKRTMFFRSSYEEKALDLLERDPSVEEFDTECVSIPYTYEGRSHFYIPDVWVKYRAGHEKVLEIKMKWQRDDPIVLVKEIAARAHAQSRGWEYEIWTEDHLSGDTYSKRPPCL